MEADEAFALYRACLKPIGVWPLEEASLFKTVRYVVAATAMASLLLHTLAEMYLSNAPISGMAELSVFCSSAFLALVKHTFVHIHRDKLAKNLESHMIDWAETKDSSFLRIMRSHVKVYKYQFLVYYSVGYIGTTLFFLRTILLNSLKQRQLEDGEDFEYTFVCQVSFLSRRTVAKYYLPLMIVQYLQSMYTCTSGAGIDCFFFAGVFHLCAQLEILKNRWYEMEASESDAADPRGSQRRKVIELIERHRALLDVGARFEASFNSVVLVQLLTSIVLICMSGFSVLVAMKEEDYVTALVSTNCISFMITETFIYGYASDYLITQSESIVQAAYSIAWYEAKPRTKRDVCIVVMRARMALCISAGKFFAVTRNTIVQLLKTTASFLSVIRITLDVGYQNSPAVEAT